MSQKRRRPSERDMEARWRGMTYDDIASNLFRCFGEDGLKYATDYWSDLPTEVREKIKDWVKTGKRQKLADAVAKVGPQ